MMTLGRLIAGGRVHALRGSREHVRGVQLQRERQAVQGGWRAGPLAGLDAADQGVVDLRLSRQLRQGPPALLARRPDQGSEGNHHVVSR